MFLEVAPQTVECVSGVMRAQCLRVRERRFDAQGARRWFYKTTGMAPTAATA